MMVGEPKAIATQTPVRTRPTRRRALGMFASAVAAMGNQPADANAMDRVRNVEVVGPGERSINVRLFWPSRWLRSHSGFIVFSHGANSSAALYDRLLGPLSDSGFLVAAPTHVDSESNPDRTNFGPSDVFRTRIEDITAVTDAADELRSYTSLSPARFDSAAAIVAGHSYGALLALFHVGAQPSPSAGPALRDARYRGAIAISPPGLSPAVVAAEQMDTIAAPILVTTGERDILPGFVDDWRTRLLAFNRTTVTPAFALVLPDVDHYFGGLIGRLTTPGPPQAASLATTARVACNFARSVALSESTAARRLQALAQNPQRLGPGALFQAKLG